MPLVFAPIGKELRIIKILAAQNIRKHLENLGLVPDGKLTVISVCGGNVICQVHDGRLALDKDIATKILVQEEA